MSKKGDSNIPGRTLRRRAEAKLATAEKDVAGVEERDPLALVHELRVHQVELEMQNEELQRSRQESEELREKYQDLYDFAPLGYVTLDANGAVREANLAAAALVGCDRHRLVGRPLFLFLAPQSRNDYDAFLRRLLAGAAGARCEARLGANATRQGWLLLDGGTFIGNGKTGPAARAALIDISERKRFEDDLCQARKTAEEASRAKGQFLANMSHELRTPMTGVIGMLDLALGEELTPVLRSYLEVADSSARSLLRLLNDILDMTKIEAGKLSLEEEPFVLRECVAGVIDLLTPEARRKGLDLTFTLADGLPEIAVGDRMRLQQVLTNLVGNAVKFTDQGYVKTEVTGGDPDSTGTRKFTFTVTDTGIGIPADKKELIFQMFSQADISHARRFGGAGLGLAISRELAILMGGTISFASKEGAGSTFTFTVPLGETRSAAEPVETHLPETEESDPRLLLVEDDPVTLQIIDLMLRRANFDLDIAVNGRQGIEMWETGNYDLVLMDVQMPGMDGFEATRTIREKERARGGHTPIVAMTAFALKEDEDKCLAAGMDAYVPKPIDFRRCIDVIRDLIKQPE